MSRIEQHGTGLSWFHRNANWIAPLAGFGVALGISYGVIRCL